MGIPAVHRKREMPLTPVRGAGGESFFLLSPAIML
jgi:hypothetical protein